MTPHPYYLDTEESRRWPGLPDTLLAELKSEAGPSPAQSGGGWYWRVLPSGIVVALRVAEYLGDRLSRYQLRLSRKDTDERPVPTESEIAELGENPNRSDLEGLRWRTDVQRVARLMGIEVVDGSTASPAPYHFWLREKVEAKPGVRSVQMISLLGGESSPGLTVCRECRAEGVVTELPWKIGIGASARCPDHEAARRAALEAEEAERSTRRSA